MLNVHVVKYTHCYFSGSLHVQSVESRTLTPLLISVLILSSYILNSMALVRERTIPTERPPPVGEVTANFYG
jgi:hypothetical protein